MRLVEKMAREVLEMSNEIEDLREQVAYLKDIEERYLSLLHGNIEHNKQMAFGLLKIAMTPGVMESMSRANEVTA